MTNHENTIVRPPKVGNNHSLGESHALASRHR